MNYFIQIIKDSQVIPEHNTTCDDISIEDTIEYFKIKLTGKADMIKVYTYDTLINPDSIKYFGTIHLKKLDN